jgi:hypothetical protein
MKFEQLRKEAEMLLSKYQDSKDEDEMRLISNRFSEVDAILDRIPSAEDRPKKELSSTSEPVTERAPAAALESVSLDTVIANPSAIPSQKAPAILSQNTNEALPAEASATIPKPALPIESKKPSSALDLMPVPDLEGPKTIIEHSKKTSDGKTKKYSTVLMGDLGTALASVKDLVNEYSSRQEEPPSVPTRELPKEKEPESPAAVMKELVEEFRSASKPSENESRIPDLDLVMEEIDQEEKPPEVRTPVPEMLAETEVEEAEIQDSNGPAPIKKVEDSIPKSVSEALPKFQLSAKMRICHQCGHETRLAREQCQKCGYEDQSLGILDAVIAGNLDKVRQILLVKPLVVMTRTSHHEWTMLHMAASGGNINMVQLLVDKGAKVNAQNTYGKTPLHYAASKGHTEIVKKLLHYLADTEMIYEGKTPLELAQENGHQEIVGLLKQV